MRSTIRRSAVGLSLAVGMVAPLMLAASPVSASAPVQFGPFTSTYSFIGFNCDGFDILIEGSGTDRFTVFFDASGGVTKVVDYARYPHDVLTNTVTGRSIVVRGEWQETRKPIPGTNQFTETITGFRYMVNEPGVGATIRDVGRIVYGDLGRDGRSVGSRQARPGAR